MQGLFQTAHITTIYALIHPTHHPSHIVMTSRLDKDVAVGICFSAGSAANAGIDVAEV